MQTMLAISVALTFKVPENPYPRMSLSGDGVVIPAQLTSPAGIFESLVYINHFLSRKYFPENSELGDFENELVFFPVRRMNRVPKILEKLGLRAPTYHHAAAFGLRIEDAPVSGMIIFPHTPVFIKGVGNCQISFQSRLNFERRYVCISNLSAYKRPVWAVGIR
ncbi:MAG: hypothetical protein EXS46_01260 [Candidatus Taylorbacteria bacterium]|nr:hypothetical protein [Candidatus Taylorbacteria bacterium]